MIPINDSRFLFFRHYFNLTILVLTVTIITKANNNMQLLNRILDSIERALEYNGHRKAVHDLQKYFGQHQSNTDALEQCERYLKTMIEDCGRHHFSCVKVRSSFSRFPTFDHVTFYAVKNLSYVTTDDMMLFIQEHDAKRNYTVYCLYNGIFQRNYIETSKDGTHKCITEEHTKVEAHFKNFPPQPNLISQTFIILQL